MTHTFVVARWLVAVAALLALLRPAIADDKGKAAAAHYRQGKAFENAGEWEHAITEYKAAFAIDDKPSHLFNIARAYDQKGDARSAVEYYDKFLARESEGASAKAAREHKVIATKKIVDEDDRKKAEEDARKKAADLEQKRLAAENHLRQAAEFARSNRWVNAADEYLRAADADGDLEHVFDAAAAYRKAPELAKARATFERYRDKVQVGGRSDLARKNIAEITDEMSRLEARKPARSPALRAVAYSAVAVGGLAVISGLVFGGLAHSKWNQAKDVCGASLECDTDADLTRSHALARDAHNRGNIASGLTIGGAIATAGGLTLFLLTKPRRVSVAPQIEKTTVGVHIDARF
jgi:tetratricopeptide (TPR) repeat protein